MDNKGYEVIEYDEWTLNDFLPNDLCIINRDGMKEPMSLEIVDKHNWNERVTVWGEGRDARLVLKALNEAMKKDSTEFNQGVVWAIARMIEMFDQPSMGLEVLNESDITYEDMKVLCEYDLAFLRSHDDKIPKGVD